MKIAEQHVKLIEGNDQVRSQKCLNAIMKLLDQYDCIMKPEITFSGNQIISKIHVEPKPRNMNTKNN